MKKFILLLPLFLLSACGSDGSVNPFRQPQVIAVDSTNDRLFIMEKERRLFIATASTRDGIGDQPVVNKSRNEDIYDLLPLTPTHMVVINSGSTSRLFITGSQEDDDGNAVTNRILVLDYDGSSLTVSSLSPLIVSDNDGATDDTADSLGDLMVDTTNARLYVTNTTKGFLASFNTDDGTTANANITIAGSPNTMSLDSNRLYIANSTSTDSDQVITVMNTDDFSTTTIDVDIPTDGIAALSNSNGTVLLAKQSNAQVVLVRTVDTGTFADSTAIAAGDNSVNDGQIDSTVGITSVVGEVFLAKDADGIVYGYAPQADGNVEILTIESDLSSFVSTTHDTTPTLLQDMAVLLNDDGTGNTVFVVAVGTGDVLFNEVGSTQIRAVF